MTWAAYLGLPLSLADVGEVLGLEKKKLTEGKELINTSANPAPHQSKRRQDKKSARRRPEKWVLFNII